MGQLTSTNVMYKNVLTFSVKSVYRLFSLLFEESGMLQNNVKKFKHF